MYDAIFKVIIFGDAGSGKTTLLKRFMTNLFISDTQMTIGVDFEIKTLVIERNIIKLQIWDFGGEERFRFLLPRYIRGAGGGIFMYDITNYSSLIHVDDWLSVVKETEEVFPIILIGGKADLEKDRQISKKEGMEMAKSRKLKDFIECSSKTGRNVELIFDTISRLMLDRFK
ncbi:MAG: GTP-binding protein [Candidatus Lokiarchaeota archaeon]|jgi:small GTP-binding protein